MGRVDVDVDVGRRRKAVFPRVTPLESTTSVATEPRSREMVGARGVLFVRVMGCAGGLWMRD